MSSFDFYPFYPKRILWMGMAILGFGLLISGAFLGFCLNSPALLVSPKSERVKTGGNVEVFPTFSFNLKETPITFPVPRVESEMTFSFDPPRPDRSAKNGDLFIRFKQSAQSKRIALPCRIDLQFNGSALSFSNQHSPFWVELSSYLEEKVQGVVFVETANEKMETESFIMSPQASPIQGALEFTEGSPFRILGEARWIGHDVFAEKYGRKQTLRVAIGGQTNSHIIDLRENEWMVWRDGWMKGSLEENTNIAARLESVDSKGLILEGWNGETHIRLSLPLSPIPSFKIRGEEIFSSIRVRSEKQISCTMEKQCLILRVGDWVMKSNGRWKILRKKEEKEAYQSGKIGGELFVFEKIESKQGQKVISGCFFNTEKSQAVPIDLFAHSRSHSRREPKEK